MFSPSLFLGLLAGWSTAVSAEVSCSETPVAVSSGTFANIVRYHSFAAAAYADPIDCPKPPGKLLRFINVTASDTQVSLFKPGDRNELVLAFRGSSSPKDLDTDFDFTLVKANLTGVKCSKCHVHRGFQSAYQSVEKSVAAALAAAGSSPRLVVVGHSLGAGVAALAATSLAATYPSLVAYTYGEPRNGDPAWASYVDSKVEGYLRVTHSNDGVPQIPPQVLGFQHHSTEYWISKDDGNSAATTYKCPGVENSECNAKEDFGSGPINGAHVTYHGLTASSLFNPACGYKGDGLPSV